MILFISLLGFWSAFGQTTAISYQDNLNYNGVPANGKYDFIFRLFTASGGNTQVGADLPLNDVSVTNGVYTVSLPFDASLFSAGSPRFLEILVRPSASVSNYTTLTPRRELTSVPTAVSAASALNANALGNITADRFLRGDGAGRVGIGTIMPTYKLQVSDSSNTGLRVQTDTPGGTVASFGGYGKFLIDAPNFSGGRLTVLENGNIGFGNNNPQQKLVVEGNTILGGWAAINGDTTINLGNLSVNGGKFDLTGRVNADLFLRPGGTNRGINFGVGANANTNSTLFIAQYDGTTYQDRLIIDADGKVRATTPVESNSSLFVRAGATNTGINFAVSPNAGSGASLSIQQVDGTNAVGRIRIQPNGNVSIGTTFGESRLNVGGTLSILFDLGEGQYEPCVRRDSTPPFFVFSACSSSIRYKENVDDFKPGLDLIRRLRPVSFDWKSNKQADLGLIAEEVAAVEPLLATYDDNGEIRGVKYNRVGVVLVNAVNEQQKQIEEQQTQIDSQADLIKSQQEKLDKQQSEIEALKRFVCSRNPAAEFCQPKD